MLTQNYGLSSEKVAHCAYLQILLLFRPEGDLVSHQSLVVWGALQPSFRHETYKKDGYYQVLVSTERIENS